MPSNDHRVRLFRMVRKYLQQGIYLDRAVIDYMEATFSSSDPDVIMAIISDEADVERDVLLELIFYPDMSLQLRLERLIVENRFLPSDEKKFMQSLFAVAVPLYYPGNRKPRIVGMTPDAARAFVRRLNITWQADQRLTDAINHWVPRGPAESLQVKMRNAGGRYTEKGIQFLCTFLERFVEDIDCLFPCFDLIMEILGEKNTRLGIYQILMKRKWLYHRALWQAEKQEKQLKQNSMDTLMMHGVRTSFVCREDMIRRMDWIDTISRTVFGKINVFHQQEWYNEV